MGCHATQSRIVIVDDALDNLNLLIGLLQDNGHKVSAFRSGAQVLAATSENLPDLFLLDVTMPEMDGFEVCRRLKNNPKTMNIPIIFITARNDSENETKGLNMGAVDYIAKPLNHAVAISWTMPSSSPAPDGSLSASGETWTPSMTH